MTIDVVEHENVEKSEHTAWKTINRRRRINKDLTKVRDRLRGCGKANIDNTILVAKRMCWFFVTGYVSETKDTDLKLEFKNI